MRHHFDIAAGPLPNGTLIEASAGTGKTHAVASYVARSIALSDDLRIGGIIVTTYTRNASAELRDRIRARLVSSARILRLRAIPPGHAADELDAFLLQDLSEAPARARRLERAVAEFDTAIIGTIHSVCARLLRKAGRTASEHAEEDRLAEVIEEVINDAVVTEGLAGRFWDEQRLQALVAAQLGDPFITPWYDEKQHGGEVTKRLKRLATLVGQCVEQVRRRMATTPSYDDLLRLAWEAVAENPDDPAPVKARKQAFVETLRQTYKLAIIDEAQDTSRLQWELLHAIFPPRGANTVLAVGDPKQAIYGFRGADVTAYSQFAQKGVANEADGKPRRTLSVNRRSDGPLIQGLNAVMEGAQFGDDIPYLAVEPAKGREQSLLTGLAPLEFLDVGDMAMQDAAVRKVHELLSAKVVAPTAPRPFRPGEVCVLVRANWMGTLIAKRLGTIGIPAVTTGTSSVMTSPMAGDLLILLRAMERPSDTGRVRRAVATIFLGMSLSDVAGIDDAEEQRTGEWIASLHAILQRRGLAAMAAAINGDRDVAARIAGRTDGERCVVDFSHLMELLHDATDGKPCHAESVIEAFGELSATDDKGDLVSRRVESDADAVRIMTVHTAKGLQFPAVVVVDGWSQPKTIREPAVFYARSQRRLDIGYGVEGVGTADQSKSAVLDAETEEKCRLLYVAVTRPQHHLSVLRSVKWRNSLLPVAMPGAPETAAAIDRGLMQILAVRSAADLSAARPWSATQATPARATSDVAPLSPNGKQASWRRSFTGITAAASRRAAQINYSERRDDDEGDGERDEESSPAPVGSSRGPGTVTSAPPSSSDVDSFVIADVPAGASFGTAVHDMFERIEAGPGVSESQLAASVRRVVDEVVGAGVLKPHRAPLAEMLSAAVLTPFGGPPGALFRDLKLADFEPADRLTEMRFAMGLATRDQVGVASDIGRLLRRFLPADDPLAAYGDELANRAFDVPLAGMLEGSIDAVLRLPGHPADAPRLLIADYKTNKLHRQDDVRPLAAYSPARLVGPMVEKHYPLQAIIYGTAVWRMLRWRLRGRLASDPGECIAGIVYGFVRGMKGAASPVDAIGRRYGVFTWQPPAGIWKCVSDLLAGDRQGVSR